MPPSVPEAGGLAAALDSVARPGFSGKTAAGPSEVESLITPLLSPAVDFDAKDGRKTANSIAEAISAQSGGQISPEEVLKLLKKMQFNGSDISSVNPAAGSGAAGAAGASGADPLFGSGALDFDLLMALLGAAIAKERRARGEPPGELSPAMKGAMSSTASGKLEPLLSLIKKGESAGSYDAGNGGTGSGGIRPAPNLGKKLTDMTIGEVMEAQKNKGLFAAGAYQIIPSTMKAVVKEAGLKPTDKFSKENQDKLGIALMMQRPAVKAYITGAPGASRDTAMLELSKEWASLPNPKTGKSYYSSDGVNASSHSVAEVAAALDSARAGWNMRGADGAAGTGASPANVDPNSVAAKLKMVNQFDDPDPGRARVGCGRASVTMVVNAWRAKAGLPPVSQTQMSRPANLKADMARFLPPGAGTKDVGFNHTTWPPALDEAARKGNPSIIGVGPPFSPGYGHIMVIAKIDGDKVTLMDPNGGKMRETTKQALLNAKSHSEGSFALTVG